MIDNSSNRPRNILYIFTDDQSFRSVSCYPGAHPWVNTPNIDRLAREGMRFDRAFLTTSSCSPSRSSILTGRYPHSTGAGELHQPLPESQEIVTEPLRVLAFRGGYPRRTNGAPGEEFQAQNSDINEGGRTIEYRDEDPYVRRMFEETLEKEGASFAMPEEVYR